MSEKVCQKCKQLKPFADYYKRTKASDGLQNRCKPCQHADGGKRAKSYWDRMTPEQKARVAAAHREYQIAHPEKASAYTEKWRQANLSKWKEGQSRRIKIAVDQISDAYVRRMLAARSPLRPRDFPDQLVQLKRQFVALNRQIKSQER